MSDLALTRRRVWRPKPPDWAHVIQVAASSGYVASGLHPLASAVSAGTPASLIDKGLLGALLACVAVTGLIASPTVRTRWLMGAAAGAVAGGFLPGRLWLLVALWGLFGMFGLLHLTRTRPLWFRE